MEVTGESEHAPADSEANYGVALEVVSIQNEEGIIDKGKPDNYRTMMQSYEIPFHKPKIFGKRETLFLAYQTIGVVYGDLGTSPLYVFSSVGVENPKEREVLGILSLIFWTLTMIALVKYVIIVLRADDHGEGGTFAVYSLLSQYVNLEKSTGKQFRRLASDTRLKFFSTENGGKAINSKTKELLEKSATAQRILLIVVMMGTCMVIGDGALTPAISVMSAVQGIQARNNNMSQGVVVLVSFFILLLLFLFQKLGTSKVSFMFSPIMITWFVTNTMIGLYNIVKYYPGAFKAFSPYYIYYYFHEYHKQGWVMLGGVVLCITGAEAMFADLGHFNRKSIQLAFCVLVYPSLLITYTGQAAYLIKNPGDIGSTFYKAIPQSVYWPMFIVATLAAIVASQALITATFSIIKQSMALSCFPRVKIVHTSQNYEGQIYSPEVNYVLMVICLAIVVGFRDGTQIGNAYGVAVVGVMFITTCLVTLVMLVVWNMHVLLILPFTLFFAIFEGVYLSSVLNKVPQGGWCPFLIAAIFLTIMFSWNYGRQKKYKNLARRKLSIEGLNGLVAGVNSRVPGICFFCSDLIFGLPPIIEHYVKNVGTLHEVLVIITIRMVPVKTVLLSERFMVGKLEPKGVYKCVAQYGYKDVPNMEGSEFINQVVESLKDYLKLRGTHSSSHDRSYASRNTAAESNYSVDEELQQLELANNTGVVYVLGKITLKTNKSTGPFEGLLIDKLYRFLQNNCRSTLSTYNIPPAHLLQVGMVQEI